MGQTLETFRRLGPPRLGRHAPLIKKTIVTAVILTALYWGVTSVVAYITAPRLEMTMSPVVGRIAVVAEPAKIGPIARKVTYTGSVSSFQDVTVYPRAEGWVTAFKLYEGDQVRRGEVIARLDRAELGAAAAEAKFRVEHASAEVQTQEANLARARVEIAKAAEERAQAEAALREAEAGLVQAKADVAYVEAEFGRDEVLVKNAAISQSSFDLRRSQLAVARAKIAQAEARIKQMQAGIARAQAHQDEAVQMVAAAEGSRAAARARVVEAREGFQRRSIVLGYADVEAPISGRVAKRHIYAGILVKPGMPIVDLQDLSRVRIQARVAEPDLPFIRAGTEAVVRFLALPADKRERRARVTTVFPQLDPVSRTATVEILLDNPGELIKPDMYAVVDLILERREKAVIIPRQAILDGPDGKPTVYVTDAVTAMSRPVKLGIAEGERVEILDGVKEGEMVVAKGQRSLSEGAEVNVVPRL
ncbi:MAG: efflux RND transporter periplasmic adaptor subunit [candidate division NC10 bacterium]|nr:efflux RND transporter periplasmic adaptor subunit [candidate division NC10 bacterium]